MISLHRLRWFERELHTRLPFRYGIAVMERVPHVWLEIEATIDGQRVVGQSADHLPPKWFTKDAARGLAEEIEEMRQVLTKAGEWATGAKAETVHDLMQAVNVRQEQWAEEAGIPPLLAHFGVTFVERALIDAYCRRHGESVGAVLRANGLGVRLGDLHAELGDMAPSAGIPDVALDNVASRHTVGLADPLEETDITDEDRPADDLPVSLRTVCRHYRLHDFKIKVAGEPGAALARLERIVRLIGEETKGNYVASIDGNETFTSIEPFREFWEEAKTVPALAELWPRLMFVEQPLHRAQALDAGVGHSLAAWTDHPPMLIDESGGTAEDLRRALELGYIGVSHKNCKGVIHGLANRCLLSRRMTQQPGLALQMSGEDLSNVGPIALPQDLAVQAALGNASVERNGHHYFAGLSGWPKSVGLQALVKYPGLYDAAGDGSARVKVIGGRLNLVAVNRTAFGGPRVDLSGAGECWLEQG